MQVQRLKFGQQYLHAHAVEQQVVEADENPAVRAVIFDDLRIEQRPLPGIKHLMGKPLAQCKGFAALQRGHPMPPGNEGRDLLQHVQHAVTDHGTQNVVAFDEALPGVLEQLDIKSFDAELDKEMRVHAAQHEPWLTPDQISLLHFAQGKGLITTRRVVFKAHGCRSIVLHQRRRERVQAREVEQVVEPGAIATPGQFADQAGCQQAVTAKLEELAVTMYRAALQQLLPELCEHLFADVFRGLALIGFCGGRFAPLQQCLMIDLAVGGQRQCVDKVQALRNHVAGQFVGQRRGKPGRVGALQYIGGTQDQALQGARSIRFRGGKPGLHQQRRPVFAVMQLFGCAAAFVEQIGADQCQRRSLRQFQHIDGSAWRAEWRPLP